MTTVSRWLLGGVCSVLILAAAPAQAGDGSHRDSHSHYKRFHRQHTRHDFDRHSKHQVYYRYRTHVRRNRLGSRHHRPYDYVAPPYSASIEGELARLYDSGPKVHVHHGADAPIWSEEHVVSSPHAPQTTLHIVIVSGSGEVLVDQDYLGHVEQWPKGRMQLAISPGYYTVHLRRDSSVYHHEVRVREGMATIVKVGLR